MIMIPSPLRDTNCHKISYTVCVFFEEGQNIKCPEESSLFWGEFSRIVYFLFPRKQNTYCTDSHMIIYSIFLQAMVHIGAVRQTAQITWMSTEALRTGDKAIVHFKFVKCPEWITKERRFVFREGRTKAVSFFFSYHTPSCFLKNKYITRNFLCC